MDYLNQLNEEQQKAVVATDGPVMIVAGAGSGKTRVLTYRMAHLIQKGVDPFNILALTFTNKAAREMRERVEKVVGPEARNLWMGTFHSVFARMLRSDAPLLGYPANFTIYDTDDAKSLLKTIIKELNLDDKVYKPSMVLARISSAKNNLIAPEEYSEDQEIRGSDEMARRPLMHEIYERYNARCFKAGAMDFDDLLFNTNKILKAFPEILAKYQHKFKYIMVDEYQDTNYSQYVIVRRLAAVNKNICVVGDDAQSIYAFRGATIQNILNFQKDYGETKVFKLEQNYRSTQTIVKAAGSVIKNNKDQIRKEVWTDNDQGDKIKVVRAISDNEEGKLTAESIFEEKMRNRLLNKQFAILYRTNSQSRSFEEALRKMNIPYKVVGGMSFYQRKEIKDLLAYLRLTMNPQDEEALKRIINYPARGIGDTTINRMLSIADRENVTLWNIVEHHELYPEIRSAGKNLGDFRDLIRSFTAVSKKQDAYETAMHIAKHSGILKVLYDDKSVEGTARYENIEELLSGIEQFVEEDELTYFDEAPATKDLGAYLQNIALVTDQDDDDPANDDKVQMMTIHASKGLEFDHLYIVGLEENLFPNQMSLSSRAELEEERRLFYVALTRAMKKLTLSYATTRFRFGSLQHCEPSRFLDEIDPGLLEKAPSAKNPFDPDQGQGWRKPDFRKAFRSEEDSNQIYTSGSKGGFQGKPPINNPIGKIIPKSPKPPAIANFSADDTSGLNAGMRVEHQRFGVGMVKELEGKGEERKATIVFDQYGEKKIILKFAKLRILN